MLVFQIICPLEVAVHIHLSAYEWKEIGILWITLTICSSNKFLRLWQSHPLWLGLMSWDTINALFGLEPSFGRGMKEGKSGIHGSKQILIEFPLPTWKQALWAIKCFVPSILLQVGDELPAVWWFNQLDLTLYFSLNSITQRQFSFWQCPPSQFGEKSSVEIPCLSEAQTSFVLRPT